MTHDSIHLDLLENVLVAEERSLAEERSQLKYEELGSQCPS